MRSVADAIRYESRDAVSRLPLPDRIALAFTLGDADVALYMSMHAVTQREAREMFARARTVGRRPSVANSPRRP